MNYLDNASSNLGTFSINFATHPHLALKSAHQDTIKPIMTYSTGKKIHSNFSTLKKFRMKMVFPLEQESMVKLHISSFTDREACLPGT